MANVVVSRAARRDLIAIRDYIRDELSDPDAAQRMMRALRQGIESLAEMPERGKPLDAVLPVRTGLLFLAIKSYRLFYRYGNDTVEVIRILHTLQDCMRVLFP